MRCHFETDRLCVGCLTESVLEIEAITSMMTAPVTKSLPPSWQGAYTPDRTASWVQECREDGTTLLAIKIRHTGAVVGLVILFAMPSEHDCNSVDLRLGYLLSEESWGHGYASEVVEGIVTWSRSGSSGICVNKVLGGVALNNPASKRVLLKNGFQQLTAGGDEHDPDEEIFELNV